MIKTTSEKSIYPDFATLKPDLQSALIIYPLYAGLHGELESALFYFEQFFLLKEQKGNEMRDVFLGILSCEIRHLSYLYKTLYFLGVRPKLNENNKHFCAKKEIKSQTLSEIFLDALAMESVAVNEYLSVLNKLKNEKVKKIIERILLDERLHCNILQEKFSEHKGARLIY